jgi:hypothetical protein
VLKSAYALRVASAGVMAAVALSGCSDEKQTTDAQDHNSGNQCINVTGDCGDKPTPKVNCAAAMLPVDPEFKQQNTTVDVITHTEGDDQYRIRAGGYSQTGYLLPVNNQGCPYSVKVTATLTQGLATSDGWGWGYGLGACNSWTGQGPEGFSLQYAFINSDGAITPNNTLNAYPDINDLHTSTGQINSGGATHVWRITVQDRNVTINEDDGPVGTFSALKNPKSSHEYARSLPDNCANKDVFLRVFNADVTFSNVKIEVLAN